jgi:hypothetical protein
MNYSSDTSGFFSSNPTAKASLEAAAATVGGMIDTFLQGITNDVLTGSNGDTVATFNWTLTYKLPATGATRTIQTATMTADTIQLFPGTRLLQGPDVAHAAPGGAGFALSGQGFGSEWPGAVADGEAHSQATYGRGAGPRIGNLQGTAFLDGTPASYSIDYAPAVGSLWFDTDTNDDGIFDSSPQLDSFWHFDSQTPVPATKIDFYSVAMHEIIHTLGLGTSLSWNDMHSGTTWLGEHLIAENGGSGDGLVDANGQQHLAPGLMSPRLSDGVMQEPLMTSDFAGGQRKGVTQMDFAALQDIGWFVPVPVPEPDTVTALVCGSVLLLLRRRRREARWTGHVAGRSPSCRNGMALTRLF